MKKSQFIAIIIMFAAASVLIWIGAFGKDNVKNGEPTASAGVNIKNTIKPIETPAASTPSEGNPGETTPGDPSGSSGNGTTENPSASAAPSTPTPTQVPSKVTFPTVKNADFAGINNEFTYWSSRFKTGENNQNEPVFDDNIKKNIGDVDYIFLNGKSETEWEVFLTFSLNYDYGVTDKILNTLQSYNAKAVFFITYDYIVNYPDTVKRIKDEGHLVGTRGPISEDKIKSCTAEQFAEELLKIEREYQKLFGESERMLYFRPDFFSARTLKVADALGYKIVFKTYTAVSDEGNWDKNDADATTVALRLWERGAYRGSVPELTVSKRISDALGIFLKECKENNVTFKRLDA